MSIGDRPDLSKASRRSTLAEPRVENATGMKKSARIEHVPNPVAHPSGTAETGRSDESMPINMEG